jgi:hypothetical protein
VNSIAARGYSADNADIHFRVFPAENAWSFRRGRCGERALCGRIARHRRLYQSNIRVPAGLADGDYPISLRLGSFVTPSGGYITVKN